MQRQPSTTKREGKEAVNMREKAFHPDLVLILLVFLVVLPIVTHVDVFGAAQSTDATSGASMVLPDQPSGEFLVLIRTEGHEDALEDWESFFRDEDEFAVIFEDISCLVAEGDTTGQQLAERFMAQLPENQMSLRHDEGALVASKAEAGFIDVVIMSAEMADDLALKRDIPGVRTLIIKSGERQEI